MNKSIVSENDNSTAPRFHRASGIDWWTDRVGLNLPFDVIYARWSLAHALIITLLVAASEIPGAVRFTSFALALWIPGAMGTLFLAATTRHPDGAGPGIPNLLTATRVAAALALMLVVYADAIDPYVGETLRSATGWIVVAVLLVVEATDFFDGRIARRMHAGAFGAIWDMESDSVYAIALALAARHVHETWLPVLFIGLIRYLYVLAWRYGGDPPAMTRAYKQFARTTAAVVVTGLIVLLIPPLGDIVRTVIVAVVLGMQGVSFGWDLVLQRRTTTARPPTDA